MCPTYEYQCESCQHITEDFRKYEERDNGQICKACGGYAERAWLTAPQVRTAKTSRTFLDGHRNDGYREECKAAELDAEAMNHKPGSSKYKELKAEAKARRALNNNKELRDRIKSRSHISKVSKKSSDKSSNKKGDTK